MRLNKLLAILCASLFCVTSFLGCRFNNDNPPDDDDNNQIVIPPNGNTGEDNGDGNTPIIPDDTTKPDDTIPPVDVEQEGLTLLGYGGYSEGLYAEFTASKSAEYSVYYKVNGQDEYTLIDSSLVRLNGNKGRADVVGITAGTYDIKVQSGEQYAQAQGISVSRIDRSGYAHFGTSEGVGAYNNEGTLKANTTVVYVDDSTKNTVKASIGGREYVGLSAILQAQSKSKNPLCVRILGTIKAATWNRIVYGNGGSISSSEVIGANGQHLPTNLSSITEEVIIEGGYNTLNTSVATKLNGLSNRIKYSGGDYDSYYNMLDISEASNVTIEGIGNDAGVFQWGFTWKNCNSIEVRNLSFDDYTEDACSFEGSDTKASSLSSFKTGRVWVHNCFFDQGINYWDVCPEQDKRDGDGSTDIKGIKNITFAYNRYTNCHKTGLIGGSDSQTTANVTFHHNFYDRCGSRLPLGRQANIHLYNNYYLGSTGTNMSIRANAYVFMENCFFEDVKKPIETKSGGTLKLYNTKFLNCTLESVENCTYADERVQIVANINLFAPSFDTNSSLFYYDSQAQNSVVEVLTPVDEVKTFVPIHAGVLKEGTFNNAPSEGDGTLPPPEEVTPPTEVEGSIVYTFNDMAQNTYSANFVCGALTIKATQEKTVKVQSCNMQCGSTLAVNLLSLGGAGTVDYRSIYFTLTKAYKITVYYNAGKAGRELALFTSSGTLVSTAPQTTGESVALCHTFEVSQLGAYYIASKSSGINVYCIEIIYN